MLGLLGIGGADSGVDVGDIPASLRFRESASAYLSRAHTTSQRQKGTWSCWVKKCNTEGNDGLFSRAVDGYNYFAIGFKWTTANNDIEVSWNGGDSTSNCQLYTSALFRDPTAWTHILVAVDTTQATAADRVKVYKNGVQQTSFTTEIYPAQNSVWPYWGSTTNYIGNTGAYSYRLDGYMARVCYVDNAQLGPESFIRFNSDINEWVSKSQSEVKAVVDAGGSGSFMLDFDNATSLTTLGYDKSAKGNNWTLNNFSLTAGSTYDHMLDVPGNSFATLNPLAGSKLGSGSVTLSAGNLQVVDGGTTYGIHAVASIPCVGKVYVEITAASYSGSYGCVGLTAVPLPALSTADGYWYRNDGNKDTGITVVAPTAYGASYTTNDVIGIAYDSATRELTFYKNGVSQGVAYTLAVGEYFVACGDGQNATTYSNAFNFGQAPLHASATYDSASGGYFRYTPPSGFKALCQANMPTPAILNPEKHFDVALWTGDGASPKTIISGLQFQPDMIWGKTRNGSNSHTIFDSVRGAGSGKVLSSNGTQAEGSTPEGADAAYGYISAFNATGVTTTQGSSNNAYWNGSGNSYVGWLFKAGGAAVTNNAGSITSQVSANVEAGFSIVTYTGNEVKDATVGHGLGVTPKLIITKCRSLGGYDWPVHHDSMTTGYSAILNGTGAQQNTYPYFNAKDPTSTVFYLPGGADANRYAQNKSAETYVAYCFAEIAGFSRIGSYTGNGSADGPHVECGFKPKFVMIKASTAGDANADWVMYDSLRSPNNVADDRVWANVSAAEASSYVYDIDFGSNFFKPRGTPAANYGYNTSGVTYIFIAFADVPAKYSLAR